MLYFMCEFVTKSPKLCFKSISREVTNYKRQRFKKNFMFRTDLRFFTKTKLAFNFMDASCEKLPLKASSYFLQIQRKNHFRRKTQRYVFKPVNKSKERELLHASLIEALQKCKCVEEQIKVFHSVVKLPSEDINCRYSVCQDLERDLQSCFPSCSVRLVGSSVHGFGFKGCDVDLSIHFQNGIVNEQPFIENPWLNDESSAKAPGSKVFSAKYRLLTIRKILQGLNYEEPLTLIPGRCPILNFTVRNLSCDLAVNSRSAFHSTNLMLLCGKLDERVTPLMQIIIYWAKQSKLVGGPVRFKTYAIFLMVLYFLQTRKPPVLPSVETIFEKTEFLRNLDDWSYDINAYLNQFEKSNNNQTAEELLREFFFFYRSFDFSHIICPISSSSMDKKSFAAKVDCRNSFEINTICIQDPMEPSWNVTTGVNWKHCTSFLKAIISVWKKYKDRNCWIPQLQNWGLSSLFDKDIK